MLSDVLNQSLWLDEATSVLVARDFSYFEILTKFSPGDFHPPFYYFLLKLWINIFGSSEIAARAPSILFGLGTAYVTYLIGKKLYSKLTGVLASVLIITGPLQFYYMLEARMYSMETFLTTLLILFFLEKRWLFFTVTGILLAYTDYLPLLIFIPLLLFSIRDKTLLAKLLKSMLAIGLFVLPWLPIFYKQLQTGLLVKTNAANWWAALGKTSLKELTLIPTKFLVGRITFADKAFYAKLVTFSAIPATISLAISVKKLKYAHLLWLWLTIPVLAAAMLGFKLSVFSYFRLIFVLPAFYLLIAYGASTLKKNYGLILVGLVLLVNLMSIGIYVINPSLYKEDWRSAVQYIEESSKENALSVFVTNNQRDAYRYYSESIPSSGPGALDSNPPDKIWFFRYVQPIFDPEEKTKAKIEQLGYTKVKEHDFNGIVVWEYERKDANIN